MSFSVSRNKALRSFSAMRLSEFGKLSASTRTREDGSILYSAVFTMSSILRRMARIDIFGRFLFALRCHLGRAFLAGDTARSELLPLHVILGFIRFAAVDRFVGIDISSLCNCL